MFHADDFTDGDAGTGFICTIKLVAGSTLREAVDVLAHPSGRTRIDTTRVPVVAIGVDGAVLLCAPKKRRDNHDGPNAYLTVHTGFG